MSDRSVHNATGGKVLERREKVFTELECRENAHAGAVVIDDWQSTEFIFTESRHRLIDWSGVVNAHHIALHHVLHPRVDIRNKNRRLEPKFVQRKVNAAIRVTASRGDHIFHSACTLEFGIPDGSADGVHIGVPMPHDDCFH